MNGDGDRSDARSNPDQVSPIQHRLQEETMLRKDRDVDQLRHLLELKDRELAAKEAEIRRLEQVRFLRQYERGNLNNPFGNGSLVWRGVGRIYGDARRSIRPIDLVYGTILLLMMVQLNSMTMVSPPRNAILEHQSTSKPVMDDSVRHDVWRDPLKPWQSTPPTPIAFFSTNEDFIKQRHTCIQAVRDRQKKTFEEILGDDDNLEILLVDPAYHANVGDHMLTIGELNLIEKTLQRPAPQQCHYVQAGGFFTTCTDLILGSARGATKAALWHAGGNWGDLWRDAQDVRIPSFKTILENDYKLIGLPQSLFYVDKKLQISDVTLIKERVAAGLGLATQGFLTVGTSALDTEEGLKYAKSRVIFMWREKESYEEALGLYPFVSNMVVPDMAFQLGPYAPIRNHPEEMVDIIIFLRKDHESKIDSTRDSSSIRRRLPNADLTFKIVDWSDRLQIFDTTDYFFTNSAIELLSLGKVVVCDRLHAAILAYLSGIPFVYIDQVSGKITKTLSAALDTLDGCMDGERSKWGKANSLEEALTLASKMIDHS